MPVVGRVPSPLSKSEPPSDETRRGEAPSQSRLEQEAGGWVRSVVIMAQGIYEPLHREWAINKAVHIGQQYAYWSDKGRVATDKPQKTRVTVNVIHQVIQTMMSMLLKTQPQPVVMPKSAEIGDKDAAKVAEKVLDHLWDECQMPSKEQHVASTMFETGSCFAKVIWDSEAGPVEETTDEDGRPLVDPESGAEMVDEDGNPFKFQIGRVEVEVCPPWQILPDPNAMSLDDATWVVHTRMRSLSWIREHFPEWGDAISGELESGTGTLEHQFHRYTAGGLNVTSGVVYGKSEWARVNEAWIKPGTVVGGKRYNQGAVITQCQGFAVVRDNPYMQARGANPESDWHPFVHFRCYEVGRFWPLGVTELLRPIQREINRITSMLVQSQRLMTGPKWLIPTTAGVAKGQLTDEPGEKVYYHPVGGKPEPVAPPPIPQYAFALLEKMYANVDFVSGQHGPSRGQAPIGIKSGIGLSLLQEQDASDLLPVARNWEQSLSRLGRLMLLRVSQFWHMTRLVTVIGADQQVEAFHFSNSDLGGNVDVRVVAGSGLPKSKAAQQALVEKLITLGILSPVVPQHRRVIMQMLELGFAEDAHRDQELDRRRAEQENELLIHRIPVHAQWFEDHLAHAERHIAFMKGDIYRKAASEDQMVTVLLNMHIAEHMNPQFAPMAGGPAALGGVQAAQSLGGGQAQNMSFNGSVSGPQEPQANREQTMGGSPFSETNPSMGA